MGGNLGRGGGRLPDYRFLPPCHANWVIALGRLINPLYLRTFLKVTEVRVPEADLARLEALKDQRVVLTPNHPTMDPGVIFRLSTMLGASFYWLAARELFATRLAAYFIRRLGAYSINRGVRDADALNMTRRLITDGKHWLVLFPEGINHFLHDVVMPFLPGAARLGLGALEDLAAAGQREAPVYLVPVALRYYYLQDMSATIEGSLGRLERRLGLRARPGQDWEARMTNVASILLAANEEFYGVAPGEHELLEQRLDRLREVVIRRIAEGLGLEAPSADQSLRNRVRKLLIAANRISNAPVQQGGDYARKLHDRRARLADRLRRDLRRVMEFVAMPGRGELPVDTVENLLDVLGRLEAEAFGKPRFWGPRSVTIRVGEPLDLREYYEVYLDDADAASEKAIQQVEGRVRDLLAETAELMNRLPSLAGA